MTYYHLYRKRVSLLVGQEGEPKPITRTQVQLAMEAVIRVELSEGNNPYQTARELREELHEDYGQWNQGLPSPQTEEDMNSQENIEKLAEWIASRKEVTTALELMGSEPPTKSDEIVISPEEEDYPTLEETLYGMILTEPD
jgi:hypothetical protein